MGEVCGTNIVRSAMALTPTTSIPLGFQAPSFTLPDARTGDALNSDELMQEGPSVVVFMCNHCPFVVHLVDSLVDFAAEYQARGLNFIAISSNEVENYPQDGFEQMRELATEKGFTFPYLYDESQDVARAYDAACTPDFSAFDANGKCVYRGQYDASRPGNDIPVTGEDLRRVCEALLAGNSVPAEGQVPSIGCNIKWKS